VLDEVEVLVIVAAKMYDDSRSMQHQLSLQHLQGADNIQG
jgi:hypothetical protein